MSKATNTFAPEVRRRAVRMALDHEADHPSRWAAVKSISEKIGCSVQLILAIPTIKRLWPQTTK